MYTSRFNINKYMPLAKKTHKYAISVGPGPHAKEDSLPLGVLIRDSMKYADSYKEVRKVLRNRNVLVDGKVRKDVQYPIGFMDVISIPKLNKTFRTVFDEKGHLAVIEATKGKETKKLVKIKKKTTIKGGKYQITFNDGKNIIVSEKDQKKYVVGDTLEIDFTQKNKVEGIYKLEEKAKAVILKGKHAGQVGEIEKIISSNDLNPPKVSIKLDKSSIIIPKENVFVLPKDDKFKIIVK